MVIVCPKCGAENADTEYFCTQCHAHMRSAFGAPQAVSAQAHVSLERPRSIFASPVAEQHVPSEPEPEVAAESNSLADQELVTVTKDEAPADESAAQQAHTLDAADAPDQVELAVDDFDAEQTLTIVADSTRLQWDLRRSADDVHSELYEMLAGEQTETTGAPEAAPVSEVTPPSFSASALSESVRGAYESLRKSQPQLKLPPAEALTPEAPDDAPNTSGQGAQAVLPSEATGWSWAGFVPGGAFGFALGQPLLGVLGLLGLVTGRTGLFVLWPLYAVFVGVKGRELAWRQRRFGSVAQYADTLAAWDSVGKVFLVIDILIYVIVLAIISVVEARSM